MNEHILKSITADLDKLRQATGRQCGDNKRISEFLMKYPINSDVSSLLFFLHSDQPEYDLETLAGIVAEECGLL